MDARDDVLGMEGMEIRIRRDVAVGWAAKETGNSQGKIQECWLCSLGVSSISNP